MLAVDSTLDSSQVLYNSGNLHMTNVRYLNNFGSCKASDTAGTLLSQNDDSIFLLEQRSG